MYNDFLTKENAMSDKTLNLANTAIFHLQLNTEDAIRFVARHASVDSKVAGTAIKEVMVGYKTRK
jgi:stringent starvation protein B